MYIDRLTQKAIAVLSSLPKKDAIPVTDILDSIIKVTGLGSHIIQTIPEVNLKTRQTISLERLVKEAYFQAMEFKHQYVGTEHLLLAVARLLEIKSKRNFRRYTRLSLEVGRQAIMPDAMRAPSEIPDKYPTLELFGADLTRDNNPNGVIYRDVYDSLVSALLLKGSHNILIVGDTGVGKRSLVTYLAQSIKNVEVPQALMGYKVIEFDITSFMSSMLSKGTVEYGLIQLADELKKLDRVILYIKNFQNIFSAVPGGVSVPLFFSMFVNTVNNSDARLIASFNATLFDKVTAENEHLFEDFAVINVPEPEENICLEIIDSEAFELSLHHNITIDEKMVKLIYQKAKNIPSVIKMPQRAIDLMDQCCTYALIKKNSSFESYRKLLKSIKVDSNRVRFELFRGDYDEAAKIENQLKSLKSQLLSKEKSIFSTSKSYKLTSVDVEEALVSFRGEKKNNTRQEELALLPSLQDRLQSKIIGQDEAVSVVTKALIRSKVLVKNKKRPLGSFLFLGPTGVGKTELAKVLSNEFYGDKSLIRLDMSDFAEKHTVSRLVGSPPGYVGYGEGGELTTKIDLNPESVVLFDEIEKAHPDVLNILLQIMDEGELSDARGNTFDFTKSIVILTSNLGTEILHLPEIGFDEKVSTDKKIDTRLKNNVKKILKPELINRFDDIIIFKSLEPESQEKILEILIKEVAANLKVQQVTLTVTPSAKKHLLKVGYSKEYGARGLRRSIEKELLDPIAETLLEDKKRPAKLKADIMKKGNGISITATYEDKKRLRLH